MSLNLGLSRIDGVPEGRRSLASAHEIKASPGKGKEGPSLLASGSSLPFVSLIEPLP